MRIRSLRAEPYGCFERLELALSESVTVLFGDNETGKSTLLNAYTDLLCGIPRDTTMVALAPRSSLRLHAEAVLDGGDQVRLTRTPSAAPHDLLDAVSSSPLAPGRWSALLGAVDHEMLLTGFGIDHGRLVRGGRSLMAGKGDLAAVVLEARSGHGLREHVAELERELQDLFKTRENSRSRLGDAVSLRATRLADLDKAMATAAQVASAQSELRAAAGLHKEGARLEAEERAARDRLRGLVGSWDIWLTYRALSDELSKLAAEGPALPDADLATFVDWSERIAKTILAAKTANKGAAEAEAALLRLEVDEELLARLVDIKAIEHDRGAATESRRQTTLLEAAARKQRESLRQLVATLGGDVQQDPVLEFEALAVSADGMGDLDALAGKHIGIEHKLDEARTATRLADDRLDQAVAHLRELEAASGPAGHMEITNLAALDQPRRARDQLWGHVRASWLDGQPPPVEVASSPEALANTFEVAVSTADRVATDLLQDLAGSAIEEREAIAELAKRLALVEERSLACRACERAQDDAQQAKEAWVAEWLGRIASLSLSEHLGPDGWATRSNLLRDAANTVNQLRGIGIDLSRHVEVVSGWSERVSGLAAQLGQTVNPDSLVTWFATIHGKALESESNSKVAQIHRKAADKEHAEAQRQEAEQRKLEDALEAMARKHATDRPGLKGMADRAGRRVDLLAERELPAAQLRARHPEMILGDLVEELSLWEKPELDAALADAESKLAGRADRLEELQAERLSKQQVLTELTSRRGAEHVAQDIALAEAAIEDLAERWAVTRIKLHLLTTELESHFAGHVNPVLLRAGSYLESLTDGRYVALRVFTEGSTNSLVVVGADSNDYRIEELSEGTCTQAYLALRLAGLVSVQAERRAAGLEVLPVVLDDVLMPFDDSRTAHALATLAQIGNDFQVLVLTHHHAVADAAARVGGGMTVVSLPPIAPMTASISAPVLREAAARARPVVPQNGHLPVSHTQQRPRERVCTECGAPIASTGRRGRPPTRCENCRAR